MPKPGVWVSDSVVAMVVKHPGNRHSESPIAWNRNFLITNRNHMLWDASKCEDFCPPLNIVDWETPQVWWFIISPLCVVKAFGWKKCFTMLAIYLLIGFSDLPKDKKAKTVFTVDLKQYILSLDEMYLSGWRSRLEGVADKTGPTRASSQQSHIKSCRRS